MRSVFLVMLLAAGTCFAQTPEAVKYFKMVFVVKEVEGTKILDSREYSAIASTTTQRSSIRAGTRVPILTPGTTQYNYSDVGVDIDFHSLREIGNNLSLALTADVNTVIQDPENKLPIVRQYKWNADVIVPIGKPTTVLASEDATMKRQMQLQLTATPVQ
jgi:hypothetical protein